jgi:hypothetical protein
VENEIRVPKLELDSIVEKKITEKIRGRQGQPSLDKILEKNQFVSPLIRPPIPSGSAPLDDGFALEKTLINQRLKIAFRALSWFPPIFGDDGSLRLLLLSLGGTSLIAGHPCSHKMLQSHALRGCGERGCKVVLLRRRKSWATTSRTENDLNITLEVAVAKRQRKTKGRAVKGMSERVSKTLSYRTVK